MLCTSNLHLAVSGHTVKEVLTLRPFPTMPLVPQGGDRHKRPLRLEKYKLSWRKALNAACR
jgi:hypothetical protein